MQFFSNYIEPLTIWLNEHPQLALIITFFIAFTESLAIIGSIIPGSVTMTAIGILAGSGIMRIDLTFIAATLGAMGGDSFSYLLGYILRDRLVNMWPFSRYPNWLIYGKDYFSKHGGKSVLIGRFVGPLRSLIPLIAGMMGLNQFRFFVANFLSAIGWALLYLIPGFLIGTASSELSSESATRLFLFILLFLAGIWLLTVGLKWLFIKLNQILSVRLHSFWSNARKKGHLIQFFRLITPEGERFHYATAGLFIITILLIVLFLLVTFLVIDQNHLLKIDQAVRLFLQSLRTHAFDGFFIMINQFSSYYTLLFLFLSISGITIYHRDFRSFWYWLSLICSCTLLLLICHWLVISPKPHGLIETQTGNSYPVINILYSTAIYASIFFVLGNSQSNLFRIIKLFYILILFLIGIATIYLGDNWLSDVIGAYLGGFSVFLIHWIFYRRSNVIKFLSNFFVLFFLILLLIINILTTLLNFQRFLTSYQPYLAQYVLTEDAWWNQTKPLLPVYRVNRIGQPISLFNIQYAGALPRLEQALSHLGWKKMDDSLFYSLINRINGHPLAKNTPIMSQLYLNQKPVLVMSFMPKNEKSAHILRVWRSNYHIKNHIQPIWLGSIHSLQLIKPYKTYQPQPYSINYLSKALLSFTQRQLILSIPIKLSFPAEPVILLLREDELNQDKESTLR